MGLEVVRFEQTPNPNAVKVVVSPGPTGGIRSYFNAEQVEDDALATALFGISGVTSVLIHQAFISVNKGDGVAWAPTKKAIERVLSEHE